jgi:hypothetical protein
MSVITSKNLFPSDYARTQTTTVAEFGVTLARFAREYEIPQQTALPEVVLPSGKIGPEWELKTPIYLTVERDEDGEYIVTDTFSVAYGNGPTPTKAQEDYCDSLIEYYETLRELSKGNVKTALSFLLLSQRVKHNPISK